MYLHMHIRVRIHLPDKSRYRCFLLLSMKSRHSFPCLYCVFHVHLGIKLWDSMCCTGTSMLTLNSNHSVLPWPTRTAADDFLLVPLLCNAVSGIYDSISSGRKAKQKHPQVLKHSPLLLLPVSRRGVLPSPWCTAREIHLVTDSPTAPLVRYWYFLQHNLCL